MLHIKLTIKINVIIWYIRKSFTPREKLNLNMKEQKQNILEAEEDNHLMKHKKLP